MVVIVLACCWLCIVCRCSLWLFTIIVVGCWCVLVVCRCCARVACLLVLNIVMCSDFVVAVERCRVSLLGVVVLCFFCLRFVVCCCCALVLSLFVVCILR